MLKEYGEFYKTYSEQYGKKTAIFLMVGSFYELYDEQNAETGETKFNVKDIIDILGIELKTKKESRRQHTEQLVNIMKSNEIDCFDVNNGKLLFSRTKVKTPLNKSQMVQALMEYFNNDEPRVRELEDRLMSARKEKITETIRRKINK